MTCGKCRLAVFKHRTPTGRPKRDYCGRCTYEMEPDVRVCPASVTKTMTVKQVIIPSDGKGCPCFKPI